MFINRNPRNIHKRGHSRGFTLIEVTLSLIVFSLLVGSIYMMCYGSAKVGTNVELVWNRNQQIQGLTSFLRDTFRYIPNAGNLECQYNGSQLYLRLRGISSVLPNHYSSSEDTPAQNISFVTRYLEDGTMELCMVQQSELVVATELPNADDGFPIFQKIKSLVWRFYDYRTQEWQEDWSDTSVRPQLIELGIELADQEQSLKLVFWIPNAAR